MPIIPARIADVRARIADVRKALLRAKNFGMSRRDIRDALRWGDAAPDEPSTTVRGLFGGFNMDDTWYHGTGKPGFTSFKLPTSYKTRDTGIFMSDEFDNAATYVDDRDMRELFSPNAKRDLTPEDIFADPNLTPEQLAIFERLSRSPDEANQLLMPFVSRINSQPIFNVRHEDSNVLANVDKDRVLEYIDQNVQIPDTNSGAIYPLRARLRHPYEINWQGNNWGSAPDARTWHVIDNDSGDVIEGGFTDRYDARLLMERARANNIDATIEEESSPDWTPMSTTDEVIRELKRNYPGDIDSVIFRDIEDFGGGWYPATTTTLAVFDPRNLRHTEAKFELGPMLNPDHPRAADLMAGIGGGVVSAELLRRALAARLSEQQA